MSVIIVLGLFAGICVGPGYEPTLQEWEGPSYYTISGRPDALVALNLLFDDLEKRGGSPVLVSGYRSYERQAQLYESDPGWTEPAGCSRHQLGTAFDVGWMGYGLRSPRHDHSELWELLEELAPRHGFIIPYDGTYHDMPSEPWHLQYTQEVQQMWWRSGEIQ